jgi:chromosome segregation protein
MTYIKRLVIKGFKSFARETAMHFDKHTVVVVGPNGSGKSNITDALCFVLGRLSIKSIRAAKASHLIFSGNKDYKPASIAYVEIAMDNEDKTFALEEREILIRRTVKKNGQSIYKINNQVKTRQEVLELLSQAGIDPHGFNIVLQGEIEKFVKMPAEDRRKVIEEVAGISVYEMRKEKSIKELDKTHEKLKQVNAVLRERTNYLKNLENEREQALRYQKLQASVKKCKASIIHKNIQEKTKYLNEILKQKQEKDKTVERIQEQIQKTQGEINGLNEKIDDIGKTIQKSSGLEQDTLNKEISKLRQEIAGSEARKEHFENQILELDRRKQSLQESIKISIQEIEEMKKEKGKNLKQDIDKKKTQLEEFEESKRKYLLNKSNLSSLNSQIEDKKRQLQSLKTESNFIIEQIQDAEKGIKIKDSLEIHKEKLTTLKSNLEKNKEQVLKLEQEILEKEKIFAVEEQKIEQADQIKSQVSKLDICPLCKTQITKEHIGHVVGRSNTDIEGSKRIIKETQIMIEENKRKLQEIKDIIARQAIEINTRNIDIVKIQTIIEKKQQLKRNDGQIKETDSEINNLILKQQSLEKKVSITKISEEQYETLKLEVNEIQRSEERNLGAEITSRQRELDRIKLAIKQNLRDKEEISEELSNIGESLVEKQEIAEKKEEQAEILKKKYQKMFEEKNSLQDKTRSLESILINNQNEKRMQENEINNKNIEKAQINARIDTLKEEYKEFQGTEILNFPIDKLKQKLENAEIILARIGSVNMRALEVYDGIKREYDKIKEKVEQLDNEKEKILTIIAQIDRKKKKTFMETLKQINKSFSFNFAQLSAKGEVYIEPQDKKEIFNKGLDIIVKVGPGKYFDVTSLSGGEQTLVALSLIFSIQELSPYCFYIFDEIDAALDRRNSEKLAYLLKKHMKQGQYLIITHNDSIISESSNILYGVSMQEGISKVLSLEI